MFAKLLILLFVSTLGLSSSWAVESNSTIKSKLASIYDKSVLAAGSSSQMDKRALILLNIYLDSKKQFQFGYSISHLTLAIERSASSSRVIKILSALSLEKYATEWKRWGDGLKLINQQMVLRVHFAYYLSKFLAQSQIEVEELDNIEFESNYKEILNETQELFEPFMEIHKSNLKDERISSDRLDEHFEKFVNWEHSIFIQPRIEQLVKPLPSVFKFMLKNVPGRAFELSLGSLVHQRTTLNLSCFKNNIYLKTDNFLSDTDRKDQARDFYRLMKEIEFDPSYSCYNDSYYLSHFPARFMESVEEFTKNYYEIVTTSDDAIGEQAWIYKQYRDVPVIEFASTPSLRVHISSKDKSNLRMASDPVERNKYITKQYHEIGNSLKECLGVNDVGNWYHFASWASQSAGSMLNGSKIEDLNILNKAGLYIGEAADWTNSEHSKNVLARANNLIAIEMIPLGKAFLDTFCKEERSSKFDDFEKLLNVNSFEEIYIRNAFKSYYQAIGEKDRKSKIELISLGSTQQVIGEQIRIHSNVEQAFHFHNPNQLVILIPIEKYFLYKSTDKGEFMLGTKNKRKISLKQNIDISRTMNELLVIKNKEYRKILNFYNLEIDFSKERRHPHTKTYNWANLVERLRFLTAMFRSNISEESLLENPINDNASQGAISEYI